MPQSLFRIEKISIEGFKAFTKPQIFDFGGRHIFLFGSNGLGKTSIIEAIRWCLFGLASRQGGIVKNQFYGGPCIVQLTLKGPNGHWTMHRRLRLIGGESDLTIRDPNGVVRNLEDVFPQLSRIGPAEGTHVIYAAQQPSRRRPEADITDFSYVVFHYLGLEEVPRFSDVILKLSNEWEIKEDELSSKVDSLGNQLSDRIDEVSDSLDQIISKPPWGSTVTPTNSITRDKIDDLAREAEIFGAQCSKDVLEGMTLQDKLYEIETAVDVVLSSKSGELQDKLTEISTQLQEADSLYKSGQSVEQNIQDQVIRLTTVKSELSSALNGTTLEALKEELSKRESDLKRIQHTQSIVHSALNYITTIDDDQPECSCPVCGNEVQIAQLKIYLQEVESNDDSDTSKLLQQIYLLRERISKTIHLTDQKSKLCSGISDDHSNLKEILRQSVEKFSLSSPSSVESIGEYVGKLNDVRSKLQVTVQSQSGTEQSWNTRIDDLKRELRFHHLRSLKGRLQGLYNQRYENLHTGLRDLADLRDIASQMRDDVDSYLDERLNLELPPVAGEMTQVYLRLTENPTFDSIRIHKGENQDGSMALDLRVSSYQGAGNWAVNDGILNGQALNAIQLVPYFVFSRYQEGPLLDLLLLDDPTQAFDTRKIGLLLRELSDATTHATLIVATHEEDRFLPLLKQFFDMDKVKAYRATNPDENGPSFVEVPINI